MTTEPICWMVIAPRSEAELEQVARDEHAAEFPFGTHPHPWTTALGTRGAALVSRLPGSEGADWALAEIISRAVGTEPVYTLWFDPERSAIVEWRNGKQVAELDQSPDAFARSRGFPLAPTTAPPVAPVGHSVAVVAGASIDEVRDALGDRGRDPSLRLEAGPVGVIVFSDDGDAAAESWDLSDALAGATVYQVERRLDPDAFNVLVLQEGNVAGSFRIPAFDSDVALPDILGAQTPEEILARFGIRPALLGYRARE